MKQYLLMCDDNGMEQLKALFRSEVMQFLEVQGMNMQGGTVNILVTPVIPPVTPMAPVPETPAAETPEPAVEA